MLYSSYKQLAKLTALTIKPAVLQCHYCAVQAGVAISGTVSGDSQSYNDVQNFTQHSGSFS